MGPKASASTWKCVSRECVDGKLLAVDGQIESATKTGKRLSSICDETVEFLAYWTGHWVSSPTVSYVDS